jgi:hypothetical protein
MSATATSIPDVLPVRPATATGAPAGPANAAVVDFGAIVALLSRAGQPNAQAAMAAAPPAADAILATPAIAEAPASPAPAVTAVVPAPPAVVAVLAPERAPAPASVEMNAPSLAEPGVDAPRDLALPAPDRATEAPRRSETERDALEADERATAGDAVPAEPGAIVVMPALVPSAAALSSMSSVADRTQAAPAASRAEAPAFSTARGDASDSPAHAAPHRNSSPVVASPASEAAPAPFADEAASAFAAAPASAAPSSPHAAPAPSPAPAPADVAPALAPTVPAASDAAALAAARPAMSGATGSVRRATDGEPTLPAAGAAAEKPGHSRTEHEPAEPGAARTRATGPASAATVATVAMAAGEPRGERGATVRAERRGFVAASAAEAGEAGTAAPAARDAAVRHEGVAAPAPRSVPAPLVQPAEPLPMRTLPVVGGAAPYDAAAAAAPSSGGPRARMESARESAPPDATLGAEPAAIDAASPVESGPTSFEAWTSAARATATDEPAEPEGVRAPVVDQVVTRLSELRRDGRHEITMRLDPAELGGITIDARLEGTRLTVHIRAEHGATQELLTDALPRLRESLAQQGFVPEQVSVQLGLEGGGAFGGGSARDHARPFEAEAAPMPATPAPARVPRASAAAASPGPRGGLDVWA